MDAPAAAVTSQPTPLAPASEPAARSAPSGDASPVDRAIESGDTAAFKEARRKERLELKGLVKTEPGPTTHRPRQEPKPRQDARPEPPKDKNAGAKQRIQQIDPEIQELQEKLRIRAELKRQLADTERPSREEPKATPAPAPNDGWKAYKDLPGAPKSDQFDNYEDYLDARADFIADRKVEARITREFQQREERARTHQQAESQFRELDTQAQTFAEKVKKHQQANPGARIDERLLNVTPLRALRAMNAVLPPDQREPEGPHHFIVDQVFASDTPGEILSYLTDNPADLERLWHLSLKAPDAVVREIGRLEAKFLGSTSPDAAASRSASPAITKAPAPGTTLGRRAAPAGGDALNKAITAGDTRAFKELRRQERLAGKR